jgi:hypothetical protein
MATKEQFFEVIIYPLCRGILVHIDFVYDYRAFFNEFLFGECRTKYYFKKQVCRLADVLFESGGVNHRLFFCGKCVKLASQAFQAIVDFALAVSRSAFEEHMLCKMGGTGKFFRFMACA